MNYSPFHSYVIYDLTTGAVQAIINTLDVSAVLANVPEGSSYLPITEEKSYRIGKCHVDLGTSEIVIDD